MLAVLSSFTKIPGPGFLKDFIVCHCLKNKTPHCENAEPNVSPTERTEGTEEGRHRLKGNPEAAQGDWRQTQDRHLPEVALLLLARPTSAGS